MIQRARPDPSILLVEDREDDVILIQYALKAAGYSGAIHVVHDGEQAMHYIAGDGSFADRSTHPLPALILLDIMMPKMDGTEFLAWLRARPDGKSVPVIMLDAENPMRTRHAAALGATACISKTAEIPKFADALKHVFEDLHWFAKN